MSSTACDVAAAVDDMSSTPVGPAQRRAPGTGQPQSTAAERCWVDHTRDSPTGLEAGRVFALGANSDGN